jgi:hypothetical protein
MKVMYWAVENGHGKGELGRGEDGLSKEEPTI